MESLSYAYHYNKEALLNTFTHIVFSGFRTMYWSTDNSIEAAAMDGRQRYHLVRSSNSVRDLTIDSKGRL